MMWRNLLYVALGGAAGSVLRFLATLLLSRYLQSIFPWATFAVNIAGCFLIGFLLGFLERNQLLDNGLKWLLITGFCGGFTTFSAFGLENWNLIETGQTLAALSYAAGSVIVGIAAVWLGLFVSQ